MGAYRCPEAKVNRSMGFTVYDEKGAQARRGLPVEVGRLVELLAR